MKYHEDVQGRGPLTGAATFFMELALGCPPTEENNNSILEEI